MVKILWWIEPKTCLVEKTIANLVYVRRKSRLNKSLANKTWQINWQSPNHPSFYHMVHYSAKGKVHIEQEDSAIKSHGLEI